MPQPKKKLSATRSGNRRSHLSLDTVMASKCVQCGATIASHTVCTICGTYRGKQILPKKAAK